MNGSPASAQKSRAVLILAPGRSSGQYWRDLWRYRELFLVLAWRDIAVRYKQTAIGVAWALLRPLLTMLALTFVFSRVAKLPTPPDVPYTLLVFAALLPWFLFTTILSEASASLIGNANLISKVYFPRLIIPVAAAMVALVDLGINFIILIALFLGYRFAPGIEMLALPVFAVLCLLASLGPALLVTALNVKYRDFRYIIPFIIQFGVYVTPVGFSITILPPQWQVLLYLNPAVGAIEGFRWCLLGGTNPLNPLGMVLNVGVVAIMLVWGIGYFRRTERSFADVI
ncbi:MAG: ABC transporter permease [Sphingomonas sp.]|nr:ABC transporter permease [Sphingomonas sp.]